jgi:hypothetical protein
MDSLLYCFQAPLCSLDIPPVGLSAVLLKAMQDMDDVPYLREIDHPIPGPLIGIFQFINTRADRFHASRGACWRAAELKLPQGEAKNLLYSLRKAGQNLKGITLKMKFCGLRRLPGRHHSDVS